METPFTSAPLLDPDFRPRFFAMPGSIPLKVLGSWVIRHRIMEVMLMNDEQPRTLSTQLNGSLDLPSVARIGPTRITVRADNKEVKIFDDAIVADAATIRNDLLQIPSRMSR